MRYILIGAGKGFAAKLYAFMAKRTKILVRPKRKRFKAVLCPKSSF